jgi:glycosyltransferase involved in cell wall biosynthesis
VHASALSRREPARDAAIAGTLPAYGVQSDVLPHICFVAPLAWPVLSGSRDIQVIGGAEVQQSILARAFARSGYRVSMICLDYGQPARADVDGVTVLKSHRPDEGAPVLRFLHPRLTSMWRAMTEANADFYYFRCSSVLTGFGAVFCRRQGKCSIYAGASDVDFVPGKQQIRYRRDRWIFEYGLRHVDAIVAQNLSQYANCLAHYRRDSVVIPSCYQAPAGARADRQGVVLWAGAIRQYKRPELFLDIARRLPARRFVMVGGPGSDDAASLQYYRSIERQADALGNVEFAGFVPFSRIEPYFDRAAVLINTSVYEGFPNTFLQAWARGVPSVALVDTGSRHQGEPVYVVAADARAAADEVERLMADQSHWQRASRRCHEYFTTHHSVQAVVSQYSRLFGAMQAKAAGRA